MLDLVGVAETKCWQHCYWADDQKHTTCPHHGGQDATGVVRCRQVGPLADSAISNTHRPIDILSLSSGPLADTVHSRIRTDLSIACHYREHTKSKRVQLMRIVLIRGKRWLQLGWVTTKCSSSKGCYGRKLHNDCLPTVHSASQDICDCSIRILYKDELPEFAGHLILLV